MRRKEVYLRYMLRKLEEKTQKPSGDTSSPHLMDIEQLQIENQALQEKIEDRSDGMGGDELYVQV